MLHSLSLLLLEILKLLKSADDVTFFAVKMKLRYRLKFVFCNIKVIVVLNPLLRNVVKWSDTL